MHDHAPNRTAMHPTARPCTQPHGHAPNRTAVQFLQRWGHWQCTSQCIDLLGNARPCGQAHDHARRPDQLTFINAKTRITCSFCIRFTRFFFLCDRNLILHHME
ncbi:hypothetical protein Hanom_Chr10g00880311 [Helianthus anomalus]